MFVVEIARESQPSFRVGSGTVGTDPVVRLGCGDAQQTVTVAASAGTFTLAVGGVATAAIALNAAAADVQAALEAVVGSGNVAVSGSAGGPWTVSFKNAQGGQPQPAMVADASKLTAANTQQTVTVTATGGHFTLSLGGETTVSIAYNAAAADVQAGLEALVAVGTGNVAVTGSAGGPWTVEFKGALAGQPVAVMAATDVDLAGAGHAVAVAVAQAGGAAVSVAIVAPGHDVGGEVKKYVVVRANGANTGIILIGTTVSNVGDGFILSAGQVTPPIYVDQLNKVYLKGGAADQGYSWIAC